MRGKSGTYKKDVINELFLLNIKYVNNYSEFVADSLSLNWNNYVNNKKNTINKLDKNISKIEVVENKRKESRLNQVIMVDNLLFINNLIKEKQSRYLKMIMEDIQELDSFSGLLRYYISLYEIEKEKEVITENKDSLEKIVNSIKMKKDTKGKMKKKEMVYSQDDHGSYYVHIKIQNNKMIFDKSSFEEEKKEYYNSLNDKINFLDNDKKYKYTSFEKKRRIYIKSMFDIDCNLYSLIDKKIDITYPVDKVFRYAKDIVDNIYKEIVDFQPKKSVLNNLMSETIEAYGSKNKIKLYNKLINKINDELNNVDSFVYEEIVRTTDNLIRDSKYIEFRNVRGKFPVVSDLYQASNEKIKNYIKKNVLSIIKDLSCLDCYLVNMNVLDVVDVYNIMKDCLVMGNVATKKFVLLQEKIVSLICYKFKFREDIVYKEFLKEKKMV